MKININNKKNKKTILFLTLVTTVGSSCFAGENSPNFPDSIDLNIPLPLNIKHNVNGKMIGDNPIFSIIYGQWSTWETSSHMVNCTPWTPDSSTINWGEKFIQTTICEAEEKRTRTVTYIYNNGTTHETTETEYQNNPVDDEQDSVGTKNYITHTGTEATEWSYSGSQYNCTSWSPETNTIDSGVSFEQTQWCDWDQYRTVTTYNYWANGDKTEKSSVDEKRTVRNENNQTTTGTKELKPVEWHRIFERGQVYSGTYEFEKIESISYSVILYADSPDETEEFITDDDFNRTFTATSVDTDMNYDERPCYAISESHATISVSGNTITLEGQSDNSRNHNCNAISAAYFAELHVEGIKL